MNGVQFFSKLLVLHETKLWVNQHSAQLFQTDSCFLLMDKHPQDTKDSAKEPKTEDAQNQKATSEEKAFLPPTADEEPEPLGLPALSAKDWKKFIGCGG